MNLNRDLYSKISHLNILPPLTVDSALNGCVWAGTPHTLFTVGVFITLKPRQNGRHLADDILKCVFLNENVLIPIEISLKFVLKGHIDNIPALI